MTATIVWLRHDLRLADQPALTWAAAHGAVVPLYIWDPQAEDGWPPGGAGCWWLHHSLKQLEKQFAAKNIPLIIRRGNALQVLRSVLQESGATQVVWNRRYESYAIARDATVKAALKADGVHVQSFNASLLREPWTIATKQGKPFQVFTPFWRHCTALGEPESPLPVPGSLRRAATQPPSDTIDSLQLLPKIQWNGGLAATWQPGAQAALALLDDFLDGPVVDYAVARDIPACEGVSRMSPYLHFGEISPRMIWHKVRTQVAQAQQQLLEPYLRQLGWREFAHHLLYHFPQTPTQPLRQDFAHFPWVQDSAALRAWQQGLTGYPIVDAGMRQLWHTGWMHNRVRMVAGSFLVKDLLISWTAGAQWFWDTLVDADLANNTLGWQWVGGCGADAAPYFRVFNPVSQGEKFDPDGRYIKAWVSELAHVPAQWIHRPWEAPDAVLRRAGVEGKYPPPIVNHDAARQRALAAFAQIRQDRQNARA